MFFGDDHLGFPKSTQEKHEYLENHPSNISAFNSFSSLSESKSLQTDDEGWNVMTILHLIRLASRWAV